MVVYVHVGHISFSSAILLLWCPASCIPHCQHREVTAIRIHILLADTCRLHGLWLAVVCFHRWLISQSKFSFRFKSNTTACHQW